MNTTPPPIRPQGFPKQPPGIPPASGSANTLILLSGVGLLLITLIEFIRTIIDLINVFDIAQYFGGGFLGEYFLHSNYQYLVLILFGIGGIGLLARKKWGWSMGIVASAFTVLLFLYFIGASIVLGNPFRFGESWRFIALILVTLISIAAVIMLLLPDTRKGLQIGATEFGIGAGVLGFLVLDFIVCAILL